MSINKLQERAIELYAKTGLYFGNCDGDYDPTERNFIETYIKRLAKNGLLTPKTQQTLNNYTAQGITLDDVIAETQQLMERLPQHMSEKLLNELETFINHVITADGKIHPNETRQLHLWQQALRNH